MEFLSEIGLFTVKTLLVFGGVVGGVLIIAGFLFSGSTRTRSQIEIEKLNTRFRGFRRALQGELLSKKKFKGVMKGEKKAEKKAEKDDELRDQGRIFVLDFDGDIRATAVSSLREEVTALLSIATYKDEVVLRLESGGGLVTSYGLAAAQLARLKKEKIKLTICVDKVAASGGYMMACVADRILAAPFAVLGSIGVIAQVPNFNRVLKKFDVDYREVTAGEFKRTVTVFGEITEPGMAKFREQIEGTHQLFKNFVSQHRPRLDIVKVATGEHWYGIQALELGLADEILTSDEYLYKHFATTDVYSVRYHVRKKWMDRIADSAAQALHRVALRAVSDLDRTRLES